MKQVFINPISLIVLILLTVSIATFAIIYYRKKYHEQNVRMLDCVLCNSFIIKLLSEISTESTKIQNFNRLLANTKEFFQFREVSMHIINANSVTHLAGDSKPIEATSHLEKNISIVQPTIKYNMYYSSVLEDKDSQLYVIPITSVADRIVFTAVGKKNRLTKIDLEVLTKGIKYLLEICDFLGKNK